jgi:transcriptional regulator with XRE-family HTH domain
MPRAVRTVSDVIPAMLAGASVGDRIAEARERLGWTKAELARRIGKPGKNGWRLIQKWEKGEQRPDRESLMLLAGVFGVSIEELLGVAEGQDPPFEAWRDFITTAEGRSMDAGERRMLQAIAWPPGREPTLVGYLMMLAALRSGSRARA